MTWKLTVYTKVWNLCIFVNNLRSLWFQVSLTMTIHNMLYEFRHLWVSPSVFIFHKQTDKCVHLTKDLVSMLGSLIWACSASCDICMSSSINTSCLFLLVCLSTGASGIGTSCDREEHLTVKPHIIQTTDSEITYCTTDRKTEDNSKTTNRKLTIMLKPLTTNLNTQNECQWS